MYVLNNMTSNPYTVTPDATIAETLELMRQKKVRRLPVLENGKLVGIITERKLLEVSPSPATSLSVFEINYLLAKTKVGSLMTRDVYTVMPGTLLEEAARIMRDHDVGALPVLDDGKLVGIITETDLFDAFLEIMGYRSRGTRLSVDVEDDKPGNLAEIAAIIAGQGVNIMNVATYRNELIFKVNTLNSKELVALISARGYRILSVLSYD
jgi:acetoin utilization protein AcuB